MLIPFRAVWFVVYHLPGEGVRFKKDLQFLVKKRLLSLKKTNLTFFKPGRHFFFR
jgi:hypothetical protein